MVFGSVPAMLIAVRYWLIGCPPCARALAWHKLRTGRFAPCARQEPYATGMSGTVYRGAESEIHRMEDVGQAILPNAT